MRKEHTLKTIEPFYTKIKKGSKTAEIRKLDRDYSIGDILILCRFNPKTGIMQNKSKGIKKVITDILSWETFEGISKGYGLLSIKDI